MNKILRAILRPTKERWYRWVYTIFVVAAVVFNLWAGIDGIISGRIGMLWMLSVAVVALVVWSWSKELLKWVKEDDEYDHRTGIFRSGRGALPDDGVVPIVPSSEAISPFHYAMMRALEGEQGVSIYCDDEGVWRDSDTDEPLPVQGEKDDDHHA